MKMFTTHPPVSISIVRGPEVNISWPADPHDALPNRSIVGLFRGPAQSGPQDEENAILADAHRDSHVPVHGVPVAGPNVLRTQSLYGDLPPENLMTVMRPDTILAPRAPLYRSELATEHMTVEELEQLALSGAISPGIGTEIRARGPRALMRGDIDASLLRQGAGQERSDRTSSHVSVPPLGRLIVELQGRGLSLPLQPLCLILDQLPATAATGRLAMTLPGERERDREANRSPMEEATDGEGIDRDRNRDRGRRGRDGRGRGAAGT